MDAEPMVARCFRHQNPEAFGLSAVPEGTVPPGLRYGPSDPPIATGPAIAEESMGRPDAVPR